LRGSIGVPRQVVNTRPVSIKAARRLLAPPRRARLRSRWRSRYGGANAGRLARKAEDPRRPPISPVGD